MRRQILLPLFLLVLPAFAEATAVVKIGYLKTSVTQTRVVDALAAARALPNSAIADLRFELHPKIFASEIVSLANSSQIDIALLPAEAAIALLTDELIWKIVARLPYQNEKRGDIDFFLVLVQVGYLSYRTEIVGKFLNSAFQFYGAAKPSEFGFNSLQIDALKKLVETSRWPKKAPVKIRGFIHDEFTFH